MSLVAELAGALGSDAPTHLLTDPALTDAYGTDWTRRWSHRPLAVVRPGSVEQVSAVIRVCGRHGVPVVPQGGNTGLVAGGVPGAHDAAVVLSLTRLDHLGPVDSATRQVTVAAGTTLAALQRHARAAGLVYGVDLGARDTATVGGTVATNAGGLRVCRYGDTRAQVTGLRAVLADGSVVSRLDGLPKDGAGYDLVALLIGSEGTLGVVTDVRVRLHEPDPPGVTTLIGCRSIAEAVALLPAPHDRRLAELMTHDGLTLTCAVTGLPMPLPREWPAYLLVETPDLPDLPDEVEAVVDARLLDYRERHPEAVATLGVVHKYDVSIPLDRLDPVLAQVADAVAPHRLFVYGHLAEGNMHLGVVGPLPDDESFDEAVLGLVAAAGGSIASEHGVGRAKAGLLPLNRAPADLAAMRAIKVALDPGGLLNPGVVLA
ncbi:MAG: FAD-binding oxidoreductase [Jiangellales bacterium]